MEKKEYKNNDIIVTWEPGKCIHSGNCARGLFKVFNPKARPWVNMEAGTTEEIMKTIDTCPSGALSYRKNEE